MDEVFYRVLAPPSGEATWTAEEMTGLLAGGECCCSEIDPSDRPCLTCEAKETRGT